MLKSPILFLIYNRPENTFKVFDAIRKARPSVLFVAADGPRTEEDRENCQRCRDLVLDNVDWDCKVETLFRQTNLGCGQAVSEGITWFFNNCSEGIILEDDTLPSASFFPYCSSLLEKYRSNTDIMHISGLNWLDGHVRGDGDYFYSRYPGIWGWASWADRWAKYSYQISGLKGFIEANIISKVTSDQREQDYHIQTFRSSLAVDTWDYQWVYAIFRNAGICITPNVNLVSNIGFGNYSTHTPMVNHWKANRPTGELDFPLRHPGEIVIDYQADRITAGKLFVPPASVKERILQMFKRATKLRF